ncbi:MAG: hypothetical protein ACI38U_02210 [Corynebacterium sp.]|uniref:hypothetical protein n=1 Tax=Corynebacterium sp. TaxID=1720 RepID=UPI003F06B76F
MLPSRKSLAVVFAATALVLTACGSDSDDTAATPTVSSGPSSEGETTPDTPEDPDAALKDLYNDALDVVGEHVSSDGPAEGFEYALVDITADGTPEILVKAVGGEFSAVRVLVPSDDNTSLTHTEKTFQEGAASAGGARMSLEASSDGGLLETSSQAASGQTTTTEWTFDGSDMVESGQSWQYRIDQVPGDLDAVRAPVEWSDVDDRSAIERIGSADEGVDDGGPNPDAAQDRGAGDDSDTAALVDETGQVGGQCGQVDGAIVTAGGSTSCGFAMAVALEAMQPVYSPDTMAAGTASVTATSAATGETYTMNCQIGSGGGTATCTGGNNAEVRMEKPGNGALLYLVN